MNPSLTSTITDKISFVGAHYLRKKFRAKSQKQPLRCNQKSITTRMHSSRMHTARSLTVSRCILCTHPWQPSMPPSNHACPPWPCMPPCDHAHPRATMHTPWQPCMPPSNHACPRGNHNAPGNHTCPPTTTHALQATTHAPRQPCTPPCGQNDTHV